MNNCSKKLSVAGLAFYAMCFPIHLGAATVTWVGGSGDWNTVANWSTDSLPGTNDDVVIGAGPSITVTHSTGTDTVRSVQSQQAFVLSGGSLTVSDTVQVNNTFTLAGGTLVHATVLQGSNAASFMVNGSGTFDGVTVNGVLDVGASVNTVQLTVLDGLTNNGTLQVGNPTNGWSGFISFAGTQTLGGNGTVVFGNAGYCDTLRLANGGTTLTIGPGITIRGSGAIGFSDCWGGPQDVSVINQGVISCDVSGGTIAVNAQPLVNSGTVAMSNGGSLNISSMTDVVGLSVSGNGTLTLNGNWQNNQELSVNGATLNFNGSWTNAGTINATNATVNLGGTFSLANHGVFNRNGGMVNLTGTLVNSNATLALNAATGPWVLYGGTVQGGTITASSVAPLIISGGTLDGVTVNGNWDVGASVNTAQLTVLDGLTNNGTLQVGNPTNGWSGFISFAGTQTLGGNGTVVFGNAGYCDTLRLANGGTTLTIGPGITIRGSGAIGFSDCWGGPQDVSVINQGVISCDVSGGTIAINAQPFSNVGTLSAPIGTLSLSGTYDLAGGAINLGISGLSSFGQVNFAGNVSLAGTLGVSLENGFIPIFGNQFQILSCSSESNTFSVVNVPRVISVNYSNTGVFLVVTGALGGSTVDFHAATAQDLQNALTLAAASSVSSIIHVTNGYYAGNFYYNSTNNNNLTILAESGVTNTQIIIDGTGTGSSMNISGSSTANITVQGMTFLRNCGSTSLGALQIAGGDTAIMVSDCQFLSPTNSSGMGLVLTSGVNATVTNCIATGSLTGGGGTGISISGVTGNVIVQNCTVTTNNSYGISVSGASVISITGCVISGSSVAGDPVFSSGGGVSCSGTTITLTGNIFTGNSGGNFGTGGASCSGTTVTFSNNTFTGNSSGSGSELGGAVSCFATTITFSGNTFTSNSGGYTGGAFCIGTSSGTMLTFSGNVFTGNSGGQTGGGVFCQGGGIITLSGNTFTGNSALFGGGAGCVTYGGPVTLSGNVFSGNSATYGPNGGLAGQGGGAYCSGVNGGPVGTMTISSNTFTGNSVNGGGGGSYCYGMTVTLSANMFNLNSAATGGGFSASGQTINVLDNLVVKNSQTSASSQGGGVWADATSNLFMINNTVSGNTAAGSGGGAAFRVDGVVELLNVYNNIIWGNLANVSGGDVYVSGTGQRKVFDFNDAGSMYGGWDVAQNDIDLWPQFLNPVNGDYHLQSTSPCIAAGTTNAPMLPATDLDGNPRVVNSMVDMGCYEFTTNRINLIVNPSFELGTNDWTFTGDAGWDNWDPAHTGNAEAYVNIASGSVSQSVSTTPGNFYLVSFWVAGNGFSSSATITASFGGTIGFSNSYGGVAFGYQQQSFTALATGTNTAFTFSGVMIGGTFFLDDVSVTLAASSTNVLLTPSITWTNPAPLTYGTALDAGQLNGVATFAGTNVPGSFGYSPVAGEVLNAGSNTLSVLFTPTDSVDYNSAADRVSLIVLPVPLSVTANSATRTFGQPNPVFTGTLIGLTNGDNITPTFSSSAVPASPIGSYTIVATLVDPSGRLANYTVTTNNGTLAVTAGAPPMLASITPVTGLTNGGTPVTISGSGFELGATVAFGGQPAASVSVNSPTQITALTPAGPLGVVSIVVTNLDGDTVTLTNGFTYTGPPPSILTQPSNQTVVHGSNAVFQVSALYAAGYQWQFNGGNLTDNGRITGSQSAVLTVPGVQPTDAGNYQVVITNSFGTTISAAATMSIVVPPSIVIPPQNQSVGVGGTATFTVGVGGSAPFSYQWLKGGSPLSGATSSVLTLANVQTTNQGQYSVVVTNAAGSATSASATLSVLNYCASAQAGQAVYPMGSPVPLSVQTFNCSSHAAVADSSASVWISTAGTTRSLPATTGFSGSTSVNFVPLATEAGTYQVAAALPGQSIPSIQGTFTLVGMSLSRTSVSVQLTPGVPATNSITLNNLTSVPLTGVTASVVGSHPDVQVQVNTPATLAGNSRNQLTVVLNAPSSISAQDQFYIQLTTAQGTTNLVVVPATVVPLAAQLAITPSSLFATMVGGGQTLVNFSVANTGGATSGPAQVLLPTEPWLTLVTPQPIPRMAPGQSNQVTLALTPPANLPLGAYTGRLELISGNAPLAVPFQFDCVSTLTGSLLVTVQDELSYYGAGSPNVSNATVTVTDFLTGSNVTTAVTDSSGIVLFTNLTSAYYTVAVAAPDHGHFHTTLLLAANQTNDLTAFLPLQLVDYTWVVTPTVYPDHYEFTLQTTFQTKVPWPVVTVDPGYIDLCAIQGQSNQINMTITNSGLISAQGLNLYFGSHPDWSIQPLVSSLGDLQPESSIVVPVTLTRLGSDVSVPEMLDAQLAYGVTTSNSTISTVVPIYVFDANPLDCEPQNPTPLPTNSICLTCGTNGNNDTNGITIQLPDYTFQTPQSVLVQVKLQIEQSAVIARDAFNATLQLVNNAGARVSNLSVAITVYDASNNVANSLFGIPPPVLSGGITNVDGAGVLADGATGQASWTIIPATNAAPQAPTPFAVGGSFSYILNGEPVTIPLFPVPITVLPTPILNVDYFLQHDVYADDPFTPQIEPSIPFPLAILVKNIGNGSAHDFTITSSQPKIIENSNDLVIAFQLIASQVGTNQSLSPSMTMDFGDIGPEGSADGLWYMTSTLEGQFISFAASYKHTDELGNTNTSLINSVHIHEMNHVVRLTAPTDDGLPDFLVNDTTNVDALPDIVYSSDGSTYPVTSITNGVATGVPSSVNSNITLTVSPPAGWVYLEIVDPGDGIYPIASVQRSDGVKLLVGPNVWQTPMRTNMVPPKFNNLIHIFDYNSTGSYSVTYGLAVIAPAVTTLDALDITPRTATLNAVVNPNGANTEVYFQWGSTTNYGNVTATTTLTASLNTAQAVAVAIGGLQPASTNHFRVVAANSAGTSYGADLTLVTPPLPPPIITQVSDQFLVIGHTLVMTNRALVATPPVTWSLDSSDPGGVSINPTNGVLSWTPSCDQGSSTNLIRISATDSGSPPLSSSMTFVVTNSDCVQVGLGSTVMQVGTTSSVPLTLVSSVALTNLSFAVVYPTNRFTNWVVALSNSAIGTTMVQTVSGAETRFNFEAKPGQSFQAPSLIGAIYFAALPGHSGFVRLEVASVAAIEQDGTPAGNTFGQAGRVVVIGPEPLLKAALGTNSARTITLYGNPGSSYQLLFSTNLLATNWQSTASLTLTNLFEYLGVNPPAPQIFYRARQEP